MGIGILLFIVAVIVLASWQYKAWPAPQNLIHVV
jgi:hypothetical protein